MKNFKATYIFRGLLSAAMILILGVYIGIEIPWHNSFLHTFYNTVVGIIFFCLLVHSLWDVDVRSQAEYEELLQGKFLPVKFPGYITFIIVTVILLHRGIMGGTDMKHIYNASIIYNYQYTQKTQAIAGIYDNMYKVYVAKDSIRARQKAAFYEITQLIFTNRKDGPNVSWKWLQENQPVPYTEFTQFYTDLSRLVEEKRAQIYTLEVEKQQIALAHNVMIDTFPNNLYNKLLGRKPIVFEYGFLSDSTRKIMETHTEN